MEDNPESIRGQSWGPKWSLSLSPLHSRGCSSVWLCKGFSPGCQPKTSEPQAWFMSVPTDNVYSFCFLPWLVFFHLEKSVNWVDYLNIPFNQDSLKSINQIWVLFINQLHYSFIAWRCCAESFTVSPQILTALL